MSCDDECGGSLKFDDSMNLCDYGDHQFADADDYEPRLVNPKWSFT